MPTRKQLQFNLETEFEARKISREYLKKIKMENWIDVKDRLPYKDGDSSIYCLVNSTYDGIVVRPYNEYHKCWDQEDGDDHYTDSKDGLVTHWMPLPNPPVK